MNKHMCQCYCLWRALSSKALFPTDTQFDASTTDSFENIVGKEEIASNEQFLLFPQCFQWNQVIVSPFVHIFDIISLFAAELEEPKIGIWGKGLSPLPHNPNLTKLRRKILEEILGKGEMLVTSIFFLSTMSFIAPLPHPKNKSEFVTCKGPGFKNFGTW